MSITDAQTVAALSSPVTDLCSTWLHIHTSLYSLLTICIPTDFKDVLSDVGLPSAGRAVVLPYCGFVQVTHRNFFKQQWKFMLQSYEHFNVTIVDFHLPNTGPQCQGAFLMLFHPQIQEIRSCGKRLSWCIYIRGKRVNGLLIHLMVQLFSVVEQFGVSRSITWTISASRTDSIIQSNTRCR